MSMKKLIYQEEKIMKPRSDDRMLKVSELSEFLGIAPSTVYRWVKEENLPKPYEMGESAVRWRLSEIEAWLEDRKR